MGATLVTQLVTSRTNSQPFSGGADYPLHWVSALVGRIVQCGVRFLSFLGGAPAAGGGRFDSFLVSLA